jgi:hypothetical protein
MRRTRHFIWMRSGNSELAYCSSLQKHRIEQQRQIWLTLVYIFAIQKHRKDTLALKCLYHGFEVCISRKFRVF